MQYFIHILCDFTVFIILLLSYPAEFGDVRPLNEARIRESHSTSE